MKDGFFSTYPIKMIHGSCQPGWSLGKGFGLKVASLEPRNLLTHH